MHIQIQVRGLPQSSKLRHYASHKLGLALARFSHGIQEASMRLTDINGPDRGGVDKLCRVVLRMKDSSIMVIEELGADIAAAIDRVADRVHQSVARQLSKNVKVDRAGVRQSAALAGA